MRDKKTQIRIGIIILLALAIAATLFFTRVFDKGNNVDTNVDNEIGNIDLPGIDEGVSSLDQIPLDNDMAMIPMLQDTSNPEDLPHVYDLIKDKWVLFSGGYKIPDKFIEIKGNTFRENLGDGFLTGETEDLDIDYPMRQGYYTFEIEGSDWKGKLLLDNGTVVEFQYMEQDTVEPLIEIKPGRFLLRRVDWENDYEGDPEYQYPTIKP